MKIMREEMHAKMAPIKCVINMNILLTAITFYRVIQRLFLHYCTASVLVSSKFTYLLTYYTYLNQF